MVSVRHPNYAAMERNVSISSEPVELRGCFRKRTCAALQGIALWLCSKIHAGWHSSFRCFTHSLDVPGCKKEMLFDGPLSCYPSFESLPIHMHSCTKDNHACYWNIVSFSRFPHPQLFRYVGSALRNLINLFLRTWAMSSLAEAVPISLATFTNLKTSPNRCCLACKAYMYHPTLPSTDAGQAYEVVDPKTSTAGLKGFVGTRTWFQMWSTSSF